MPLIYHAIYALELNGNICAGCKISNKDADKRQDRN